MGMRRIMTLLGGFRCRGAGRGGKGLFLTSEEAFVGLTYTGWGFFYVCVSIFAGVFFSLARG